MKFLEQFIAKCVCKGIEMYVSTHRFGIRRKTEVLPLTHEEFVNFLHDELTEKGAQSYLTATTPINSLQCEQ